MKQNETSGKLFFSLGL